MPDSDRIVSSGSATYKIVGMAGSAGHLDRGAASRSENTTHETINPADLCVIRASCRSLLVTGSLKTRSQAVLPSAFRRSYPQRQLIGTYG